MHALVMKVCSGRSLPVANGCCSGVRSGNRRLRVKLRRKVHGHVASGNLPHGQRSAKFSCAPIRSARTLTEFAYQRRSTQASPTDRARRADSRRLGIRGCFNFVMAVLLAVMCCTANSQAAEPSRIITPADSDIGDVTSPDTVLAGLDLSPSGLLSSFRQ